MSALRRASEEVKLSAFFQLFCNVDSFCSKGEPTLLGWAVIVFLGLSLLYYVLKFFGFIHDPD